MKKWLILCIVFTLGINPVKASTSTASSYVLMDMTTGRVLAGKNYNTPYIIASISKIMTFIGGVVR